MTTKLRRKRHQILHVFFQALNHALTAIVLGGVKARFAFQP
jgi:hypothetical protein